MRVGLIAALGLVTASGLTGRACASQNPPKRFSEKSNKPEEGQGPKYEKVKVDPDGRLRFPPESSMSFIPESKHKVNKVKADELAKCPTRPQSGIFINNFGQRVDVEISPNLARAGSIASGITKDYNNQVENLKKALSEFVNDYFKGVELKYRKDLIIKMMNSTRCTENSPKWPFEIDIEQAILLC